MRRSIFILIVLLCVVMPLRAGMDPVVTAKFRAKQAAESGAVELDLSYLGLTEIPDEVFQLNHLQNLVLFGNQLTSIPDDIGQMTGLRHLDLSANDLTDLPAGIAQLKNLEVLVLAYNQFTVLPDVIFQIPNLQELYLSDNQLTVIPSSIERLPHLKILRLDNNQIRELPSSITHLSALEYLTASGNPLIFPPPEVAAQGDAAILTYLRDYQQIRTRQALAMGASGVGLVASFGLLWRWKTRRGKPKQKRG